MYREIFSFKKLHETARSILYEVDKLDCCYNYENTEFDFNADKLTSSILEEMYIQPDILCRAICSNSIDNLRLLAENGYNLVKHYKHPKFKSSLHWAYYCDNLEIFNYLLESGCSINENDIFYDPEHKKISNLLYIYIFIKKKEKKFINL